MVNLSLQRELIRTNKHQCWRIINKTKTLDSLVVAWNPVLLNWPLTCKDNKCGQKTSLFLCDTCFRSCLIETKALLLYNDHNANIHIALAFCAVKVTFTTLPILHTSGLRLLRRIVLTQNADKYSFLYNLFCSSDWFNIRQYFQWLAFVAG